MEYEKFSTGRAGEAMTWTRKRLIKDANLARGEFHKVDDSSIALEAKGGVNLVQKDKTENDVAERAHVRKNDWEDGGDEREKENYEKEGSGAEKGDVKDEENKGEGGENDEVTS